MKKHIFFNKFFKIIILLYIFIDITVAYLGFHFGRGSKYFWKSGGRLYAWRSHAFAKGGWGHMLPEKILKNDTIWRVLKYILLKFCKKILYKYLFFI